MNTKMLAVLFLTASLTGCVSWPHDARSPGVSGRPATSPVSGPITADQVEPANAHRIAEAVWDELDRDQQKDTLPTTGKDAKKR